MSGVAAPGAESVDPVSRRAALLALAVIVAGAAVLRFAGLGAESLWLDEVLTARLASLGIGGLLRATFVEHQDYLPLHHLLTMPALALGGSEAFVRAPSALLGLLGIAATYLLGARAFGRAEGLAAALLLAASHEHLRLSREARAYTLLVVLVALLIVAALDALEKGRRRDGVLAGALAALAYYAHPVAVFPVAAVLLAALAARFLAPGIATGDRASPRPPLLIAAGVALALLAPAIAPTVALLVRPWRGMEVEFLAPAQVAPIDFLGGDAGRSVADAFGIVALVAVVGLVSAWRRRRAFAWIAGATVIVPFVVLSTVSFGHGFSARYLAFLLPVLAVLEAHGLACFAGAFARAVSAKRTRLALLAVLALGAALASAPSWEAARHPGHQDWRGVARRLEGIDGRVLVLAGYVMRKLPPADDVSLCLAHYLADPRFETLAPGVLASPRDLARLAALEDQGAAVAVVMRPPTFAWDGSGFVAGESLRGFTLLRPVRAEDPRPEQVQLLIAALARAAVEPAEGRALLARGARLLLERDDDLAVAPSPARLRALTAWIQALASRCDPLAADADADALVGIERVAAPLIPLLRERAPYLGAAAASLDAVRAKLGQAHRTAALRARHAGLPDAAATHLARAAEHGSIDRDLALAWLAETDPAAPAAAVLRRIAAAAPAVPPR